MPKKKENLSSEERLIKAVIPKEEEPYKLPDNWVWTRLENISEKISKGTTPRGGENVYVKDGIKFLRVENITDTYELNFKNIKYVSDEIHNNFLKRSKLEENDLLISIAGSLGRTAVVSKEDLPLNTNQAIAFVRFLIKNKLISKYFSYFFNAPIIKYLLLEQAKTTAIPNLTLEILNKSKIAFPPFNEQKRIVEKLDSLFEKTGKIKEIIEEVKEKTSLRREAVLSKAFTGELTEKWRAENKTENAKELLLKINEEKLRNNPKVKIKDISEMLVNEDEIPYKVPDNWIWTVMNSLIDVRDGTHDSPNFYSEGYPLVTSKNLKDNKINFEDVKFISKEDMEKINQRSRVEKGDILYAMIGTIGNPVYCEVDSLGKFAVKNVAIFKSFDKKISKFLKYYLESENYKKLIENKVKGTTQKFVPLNILRNTYFLLPPLEEQKEIVRILDKFFEEENKISELISLEEKVEILEKTILDKAFRGELGTGNSDDEPAIELLKRALEENK